MAKQHLKLKLILIVALQLTFGCSSLERRSGDRSAGESKTFDGGGVDDDGRLEDSESSDLQPSPERSGIKDPPAFGLILGPGMALALSHSGVLKALEEAKIPIKAVVGMEWGAVIGAIYAKQGLANDVQWRVHKLKNEDLPGKSFFSSAIKAETTAGLSPYLKDALGTSVLNKGQLPFACPVFSLQKGRAFWVQSGSAVDGVSRCLAFPPFYEPYREDLVADPYATELAVKYLKDRGANAIIFVDVLHAGELMPKSLLKDQYPSFVLWNEIRRNSRQSYAKMDNVIRVPTDSLTLLDFQQKQKLIQLGEKAGRQAVKALAEKYGI
jgi:NTE family protein